MTLCYGETISYLLLQKDALSVSGQCNAIPALFSLKMTELPLGNGLATGIQLDFHGGGNRGDNWVILRHAAKVVYRDLHVAPSILLLSR